MAAVLAYVTFRICTASILPVPPTNQPSLTIIERVKKETILTLRKPYQSAVEGCTEVVISLSSLLRIFSLLQPVEERLNIESPMLSMSLYHLLSAAYPLQPLFFYLSLPFHHRKLTLEMSFLR